MFKSERDEIRVRTAIHKIIERQAIHPELVGVTGMREDLHLINNIGLYLATDLIYKLILLELNDNTK